MVFILFGVSLLTYLPAGELSWIWDDDQYVYENSNLQTLSGLTRIWMEPQASPQYYPTVFTVLWLEYQLFGLNPVGFHFTNVILHAINAGLCYLILRRLELPAAWWIALAFGLHPVQVESVAWVTELKNVLSGFFYALAWLAFWPLVSARPLVKQARAGDPRFLGVCSSWWLYLAGVVLFICALLSKSVTATLPAGMLVALWYRQGSLAWRQLYQLMPWLIVGGLVGWNTARLERLHVGAEGADWAYGWLDRAGIAARAVVHYSGNVAFPTQQIFFYPRFPTQISETANWVSLVGVLLATVGFAWLARRGVRGPLACACFFVGTAFPALGFLNVYPHRFSFVADHFIYIASAGLLCLFISIVHAAASRSFDLFALPYRNFKWIPLALLCTWYAVRVNAYLPAFATEITLWEDTLSKNPHCPAAMQNLGLRYSDVNQPNEALIVLNRAMQYDFDRYQTLNSLGVVHTQLGNTQEAEKCLRASLSLKPDNPRARINLANLLRSTAPEAGRELAIKNAQTLYRQAWDTRPSYLAAFGLATVHYELGDLTGAAGWFEKAIAVKPNDLDAMFNYAQVLMELKDYALAAAVCKQLLRQYPADVPAQQLLDRVEALAVATGKAGAS